MKRSKIYVAIDWGAESGRVIAGVFDGNVLRLEEISRFPGMDPNVEKFIGFLEKSLNGI